MCVGGRAADPRKQELPASAGRVLTQTRRLEGNPEGGAQRGLRGVWSKDVQREVKGPRWIINQKTKQREGWG